jgi:hypothetical protein
MEPNPHDPEISAVDDEIHFHHSGERQNTLTCLH